jgi:hypothetical protein
MNAIQMAIIMNQSLPSHSIGIIIITLLEYETEYAVVVD